MDNTTSTNRTPHTDHEQNSGKPIIRSQTRIRQHTSHPAVPHAFPVERHLQSCTNVMIPPCVRHDRVTFSVVSTTGKNRRRADSSYPKTNEKSHKWTYDWLRYRSIRRDEITNWTTNSTWNLCRTTQPKQRKQERKSALRSVLHCEQALLKLWLNGWLLGSTKNLCAVTIENEITLRVWKTCHVETCDSTYLPPTPTHVQTNPPSPSPLLSSVFCTPMPCT